MLEVQANISPGESRDTKVLVSYRFLKYKFGGWREEAIMLHVPTSKHIESAFWASVSTFRHAACEIVSYLPETGKQVF